VTGRRTSLEEWLAQPLVTTAIRSTKATRPTVDVGASERAAASREWSGRGGVGISVLQLPHTRGGSAASGTDSVPSVSPHRNVRRFIYWMISSARANSDCGIVSPSALAVLRLRTLRTLTLGRHSQTYRVWSRRPGSLTSDRTAKRKSAIRRAGWRVTPHDLKLHRQDRDGLTCHCRDWSRQSPPIRGRTTRRYVATLSPLRPQGDLDSFVARAHTDPQIDKG
jgi:hypothetical protein